MEKNKTLWFKSQSKSSSSSKKYKSVYYAIYDNLKNIGNFKRYLVDNSETTICFHFPHGYSKTKSYLEIYKFGELIKTQTFYKYSGESNMVKTFLYCLYFQYILFRFVPRKSYVIVDNPVFCILSSVSILLKKFKFIYWIGDYYPNNKGFMKVYNLLSSYYSKTLEIVWCVSPPIKKIYEVKMDSKSDRNKLRMLISLGTESKKTQHHKINKKSIRLGFIGVLREQQGLDLVFLYLKKYYNSTLEIVGSGYKLEYYRNLAKSMKLTNKVKFYGFVENLDTVVNEWDIGVALYENISSNVSVYCEPTKIKNYLEYGLPVITTRATYFYKELEKEKAGVAIDENIKELDHAINEIVSKYVVYKKGVETILKRYEYNKYYDKLLKFMQKEA